MSDIGDALGYIKTALDSLIGRRKGLTFLLNSGDATLRRAMMVGELLHPDL